MAFAELEALEIENWELEGNWGNWRLETGRRQMADGACDDGVVPAKPVPLVVPLVVPLLWGSKCEVLCSLLTSQEQNGPGQQWKELDTGNNNSQSSLIILVVKFQMEDTDSRIRVAKLRVRVQVACSSPLANLSCIDNQQNHLNGHAT